MSPNASRERLQRLANAYQISCAVHAAASIGLGRLIEAGPVSAAELASQTGLKEDALVRLLRFLQTLGIVSVQSDGGYAGTEMSVFLDEIDNIAEGPEAMGAWLELPGALKTGKNAFSVANGASFYQFASENAEKAERWAERNRRVAQQWANPTIEALNLEGTERVIDLGAGSGDLLAQLIGTYPNIRPAIYELPQACESAKANLKRHGIRSQVQLIAGDLTKDSPPEADVYILSRVLLNMNDQQSLQTLSLCRKSMPSSSKLIIVETLMPDIPSPKRLQHHAHNLHLLMLWGGQQRTQSEFALLLDQAGLTLTDCQEICSPEGAVWQMLTSTPHPRG